MSSSVQAKLKQQLTKYQNPDMTLRDINGAIDQYMGLYPRYESFVFNDGRQKELVNLKGTIPVTYKGSVYNIPICIWLLDTHPYNAPMCFVMPTPTMQIKMSRYVDHNGKIYLPYLHDWKPSSSDLLSLIQVLIITFGEQPPVYSKPQQDAPAAAATPYPTQPYMPMPGSGNRTTPPYPPYTGQSYQASAASPAMYTPYRQPYSQTGSTGGYPPYPAYPASSSAYPFNSSGTPSYTPGYPPYPTAGQTTTPAAGTGTISEEHIRASLLSAVEDRVRRRLREQMGQAQAELETLRRTQQELTQGKSKLEDIMGKLEREQVDLDKNIGILQDKEQELERALSRLSEQEAIDVDEAVTTTAPLYKQLVNAFAEEAATEDAIYYLGEALRKGVIDLEVFLKQSRSLSRKQFFLRALMQKCRQKAGLAG